MIDGRSIGIVVGGTQSDVSPLTNIDGRSEGEVNDIYWEISGDGVGTS